MVHVPMPLSYDQAWDKAYGTDAGYEQVYLRKFNARQKVENMKSPVCTKKPKAEGGEKDLIAYWKKLYKQKQWHRYAPFQRKVGKGDFNLPYVMSNKGPGGWHRQAAYDGLSSSQRALPPLTNRYGPAPDQTVPYYSSPFTTRSF